MNNTPEDKKGLPHNECVVTTRDWFAGQALAGIISNSDIYALVDKNAERRDVDFAAVLSETCFHIANHMMQARGVEK